MIINSLLDTDFYKLTMAQVVIHQYPATIVKYRFKCRSGSAVPFEDDASKKKHVEMLNKEIDHLCRLRFTPEEIDYLAQIPFFKPDYIEHLRLLQLNRDYIDIRLDKRGEISIYAEGPWIATIWFEIPCLAICSETYYSHRNVSHQAEGVKRLTDKIAYFKKSIDPELLHLFKFADFGTRRRFSYEWQDSVIKILTDKCPDNLIGTSNVLLAMKNGIRPIGTMAHEFLQAHQQLGVRLIDSQKAALDSWVREYRGELGIALSDVVTFDAFLRDFDLFFAKLFDGCRHDSGDPYIWCRKLIEHYHKLKIDPRTKTAIFSDGLNFQKAVELFNTFHKDIRLSFGIGTNLTHDVGLTPLNIVMKMTECDGRPVAKISDSSGKGMCEDDEFLNRLRKDFNIGHDAVY